MLLLPPPPRSLHVADLGKSHAVGVGRDRRKNEADEEEREKVGESLVEDRERKERSS